MHDVQQIEMVTKLLEALRPVVESEALRVYLSVHNPEEPRLVLLHPTQHHLQVLLRARNEAMSSSSMLALPSLETSFLSKEGIKHHRLIAYNPHSEGSLELAFREQVAHTQQVCTKHFALSTREFP